VPYNHIDDDKNVVVGRSSFVFDNDWETLEIQHKATMVLMVNGFLSPSMEATFQLTFEDIFTTLYLYRASVNTVVIYSNKPEASIGNDQLWRKFVFKCYNFLFTFSLL
jgi:hypothetical protein